MIASFPLLQILSIKEYRNMMWLLYACGAALCVALSAFWAKAGAKKGDSAPAAGIALFVTCLFAFFLAKE